MSVQLGNLAIVSGTKTRYIVPNQGIKAILIGNESGLTVTITMQSGNVSKTLYPGVVDWFQVKPGFTGVVLISPSTVLNNLSSWPASSLIFDAIGLNDPEQARMYPVSLMRALNIGNALTAAVAGTSGSTAPLTLYGSSIADAILTTACDCSNMTGGVETSITTTVTLDNQHHPYAEVTSQGLSEINPVDVIPATPTGNGWVYKPGAGTFTNSSWAFIVTLGHASGSTDPDSLIVRFFKYTSGVYTSIGNITYTATIGQNKATYTFTATIMGSIVFLANDLIYTDLWYHDSVGADDDNPTIYLSNSATAGVANDMQITTAPFSI